MEQANDVTLVVGIGAPPGSEERFSQLVSSLRPLPGVAYVVARIEPELAARLEPRPPMRVVLADCDAPIEPGTIHVLTSEAHDLVVRDGSIVLAAASPRPIDRLFASIAERFGELGAGVLLGADEDHGAVGLGSLRAHGAAALVAADPAGLPPGVSADLVVPLDEVPLALERLAALPPAARAISGPTVPELEAIGGAHLARLADILARAQQMDLSAYKSGTLRRRLLRRLRLAGFEDPSAYLDVIETDEREQRALARDFLIGVTELFRDGAAFAELAQAVIAPTVDATPEGGAIRAWVPGCASGEEAYSIAMLLFERIEASRKRLDVQMFATDVDPVALRAARAGVYPHSIRDTVGPARLDTFFEPHPSGYRVRPHLRDAISFAEHDVLRDPPFSRMALVSCRNLLIYLTPTAQRQALALLHFALAPTGCLFLGSAETVGPQKDLFATVSKDHHIYAKRGESVPIGFSRPTRRPFAALAARAAAIAAEDPPVPACDLAERARAAILEQRVPPTLVVSGEDEVVYTQGAIEPYVRFPQGAAHLELATVLRPDLTTRVRAAVFKCRRERETVEVLSSPDEGSGPAVRVTISPAPSLGRDAALVSFTPAPEQASAPSLPEAMDKDALLLQLERELRATREDLRSTVEELETANEELRASHEEATTMNEELQSTNEELEASTEELRSVNEELSSVNTRLKQQIDELARANDDLTNFFSSTLIATVFLDEALRVRRFTPAAAELLGLGPADEGRSIAHPRRAVLCARLEEEARRVLARLEPVGRELDADDRSFVRRVLPYVTTDGRIRGVVVSFIDVTGMKAAARSLAARERQQSVVAALALSALSERDLDAFMARVVREVQQALGVDFCKLLELQPGNRELLLRAGAGWSPGLVGSLTVPADLDSQAGFTLRAREPVVVRDLATEQRFHLPALLAEHGVTSGISCIIQSGAQAYGVLGAHSRAPRAFTAEDVAFVQSVAGMVGTAIARERTRQWFALQSRVADLMTTGASLDEIREPFFAALCQELGAHVGELWTPSRDGSALEGEAFPIDPTLRRSAGALTERRFARGEGVPGWILEHRQPLWLSLLGEHEVFTRAGAARELGLVSGVGFPILAKEEVLGVVVLFSRRRLIVDTELLEGLLAIGRSVGDFVLRARAEREVESARRWFERVSDATPDIISVWDRNEDRTIYANREVLSALGYSADELREMGPSVSARIVHEEDRAAFEDAMTRTAAARDDEVVDVVLRMVHRSGACAWRELRMVPFERDPDGSVRLILSVGRDITESRRREEELRESEWRFRQILERSPVAKIVYDDRGGVHEVSASWRALTGYGRDELDPLEAWIERTQPDRSLLEFFAGSWREEGNAPAKRTLRTKRGDERTVLISSAPLGHIEDGRRIRVAAASDVTILERAQRTLQEADRQKNYFLALLGHELRNPLAAIQTATDLMREAGSDAAMRERAQRVLERQSAHVTGLVDGLLDVSRIVSGKLAIEREALELAGLIETVIEDRREPAERAGIALVGAPSGGELWVEGDALRLRQVFDNVIGNATKFTGRGGTVSVSARADGPWAEVRVEDTGVGMSEEVLAVVFEPFQQAPQELARTSGGLGLGLALSRGIVELHGGSITAKSDGPGHGTIVTVRLPLTERRHRRRKLRPRSASARLSILVIEDNEDLAELLSGMLAKRGHQVHVELHGERGLEAIHEQHPDAVLCDIGLPGRNGYEIARAVRADPELRETLLIAMSGYGQPEDRRRSDDAGFDAHLTKPFEVAAVDELLARLRG